MADVEPPSYASDVTKELANWRQGDVVDDPVFPLVYMADSSRPLTPAAAGTQADGLVTARIKPDAFVVLTQTCDLVRDATSRPFVKLAPLVQLTDPGAASEARQGHRPRYVHVPGIAEDAFADLDIVMTVEKTLIAQARRLPGLESDHERAVFARAVARNAQRFAFPNGFTRTVRRLESAVKDKHGKEVSAEGQCFRELLTVRVEAYPGWDADRLDAVLIFILPAAMLASGAPEPADATWTWFHRSGGATPAAHDIAMRISRTPRGTPDHAWLWQQLADAWVSRCRPLLQPVVSLTAEVVTADEMSVDRYLRTEELDLDYLSDDPSGHNFS